MNEGYSATGVWFYHQSNPSGDAIPVGDRLWAQPELFAGLSWYDVDTICPDGFCTGALNGFDVTGWRWASAAEVLELFNAFGVTPSLVPPNDVRGDSTTAWGIRLINAGFRTTFEGGPELGYADEINGWTSTQAGPDDAIGGIVLYQPEDGDTGPNDGIGTGFAPKEQASPYAGAWLYLEITP